MCVLAPVASHPRPLEALAAHVTAVEADVRSLEVGVAALRRDLDSLRRFVTGCDGPRFPR